MGELFCHDKIIGNDKEVKGRLACSGTGKVEYGFSAAPEESAAIGKAKTSTMALLTVCEKMPILFIPFEQVLPSVCVDANRRKNSG